MLADREITDLLRLLDDPVFLGPVPKRSEFDRRWFVRSLEMRPVLHQHLSKCHPVRPSAIRISAVLEQEQRIRMSEASPAGRRLQQFPVHATRRDCSRREPKSNCKLENQACVLSFSPFLHWALNFAYCSGVRIDFASCMYLLSLPSEQPAF